MRRIAICGAGALFVLACGQGAALRSAEEAGKKVQDSSSLLSGSNESQSSTGAVKEISLAELSAMNKASNKGTASGTGTTSGKVAKSLPEGAMTSGTAGTATRSSGAAANSSGMSVPAPRTTVPGSGSSTGVSRTSARGVGPDLGVTKDITGLERVVLKGGNGKVLTQSMMSQRCRRYIIEGTFDLAGKRITMPYGSVLDLENGELRNGTLVMDQTRVTPIYGISKETRISKVKVTGEYYETLVDLWGVHEDPVFPWDTSAPKKVYVVDLKKFGITPGYQKKGADGHYTDRQYDLMYQNGVGFTEAIQWAYKNGYDGIRFPKNDYCFTPRTTKNEKPQEGPIVLIQDLDKFDIDFGGATYYLILDSKKKSKYYTLNLDKPYAQGGTLFFIAACINLQIHDAKMVGDRALRDYDEGAERNLENSRAFALSAYCQNIRLHHMDLSGFMADGISISQTGNYLDSYDGLLSGPIYSEMGSLTITGDSDCSTISSFMRTDYLYRASALHPIVKKIFSKRRYTVNNNRGYTRIPNIYSNIEILTFNSSVSKERPLRKIQTSYLESFTLMPQETGVKIRSLHDDGVSEPSFKHTAAVSDVISSNVVVEYCSIHDNHRGGISGGSNNNIIRNCAFNKSVKAFNYSGKAIPLFLIGGTNYHINYEDSFAKDLIIERCSFKRDNSSIGKLLFGVYTLVFRDNKSDSGLIIFNNVFSDIYRNSFTSSGVSFSSWAVPTDDMSTMKSGLRYMCRVVNYHDNIELNPVELSPNHRSLFISYDNVNSTLL